MDIYLYEDATESIALRWNKGKKLRWVEEEKSMIIVNVLFCTKRLRNCCLFFRPQDRIEHEKSVGEDRNRTEKTWLDS